MRTTLTYENRSLNPHVSRIGLYWHLSNDMPAATPVIWHVIEKCRFGWHHPVDIDWEPTFLLRDSFGNRRPINPGIIDLETGTTIQGPTGYGLKLSYIVTQAFPQPDFSLLFCRNQRPFAEFSLQTPGSWAVTMPNILILQIGGRQNRESQTDWSGTAVYLDGLKSLKVGLSGGAPGPYSTPLALKAYGGQPL